MKTAFEQGPIRPPSEAKSLLVRVTRNCPWGKCAFCDSYSGAKFSLRSVEEIKEDIRTIKAIERNIIELSFRVGAGGKVTNSVVSSIYEDSNSLDDYYRSVAAWLYFGGQSVFLQDADSLIVKTAELVEIIRYIKELFPQVSRITSYCRSKSAARKGVDELMELRNVGLSRIHIGMESGYDPLLEFIQKGSTAAEHIKGGQSVVAADISLSEYVIPGLGGDRWSTEHAVETARVINAINPNFVRMRSLNIVRGTTLHEAFKTGGFSPLSDEDVVKEIRLFIENLNGISTTIVSDHALNLLEEIEGTLPYDKEKMLAVIDDFLSLSRRNKLIFQMGRRRGIYRKLSDLQDTVTHEKFGAIIDAIEAKNPRSGENEIRKYIPRSV